MAFADGGDGRLWVATTTGLFRLDPDLPALRPVAIPGVAAPACAASRIGRDGDAVAGHATTTA